MKERILKTFVIEDDDDIDFVYEVVKGYPGYVAGSLQIARHDIIYAVFEVKIL